MKHKANYPDMTRELKDTLVDFDTELNITKVYYKGKKVKVSSWREDRIWSAFNQEFDLASEMADYQSELRNHDSSND